MSRIRADKLVNRAGTGGPKFPNGVADGFSVSGIVTATSFSGPVTGNADTATSATTATTATVATNAQGITGTPNITVGTVTGTNATFSGNLTVNGTTTTIDTAVTAVDSLAVDGNVGIGTTNATSILDVRNGTIVKDQDTTQNAANPGLQLKHNGTINGSWRHDGRLEIGGQDADAEITLNSNGSATFTGNITTSGRFQSDRSSSGDGTYRSALNGVVKHITYADGTTKIGSNGDAQSSPNITLSANGSAKFNNYVWSDRTTGTDTAFYATHSGVEKVNIRANGSASFSGTVTDTSGNLRITPISAKTGDYTLVATDTGKTITRTGGNITVPQSMTAGMVVTIINDHSSTMSIIKGTGVTLRSTDGSDATKTLAAYGVATVLYISASSAYLTGSGLS